MKVTITRFRRTAMLAVTLALAVACSKPPSDSQVASNIQSRLAADSGLQNKQVAVQAEKGTVTLSGTVDNDAERQAAAKYAAAEPGVKQVINNLEVAPMSAAAETKPAPTVAAAPTPATNPMPASEPISRSKPSPSPSQKPRRDRTDWRQRRDQPPASAQSASNAQAPDGNGNVQSQPNGNMPSQTEPPPQAASAPPPEPRKVTVPSGAEVSVRLVDAIDSATAQAGDNFHATLGAPIAVDGDVVVPAHYDVEGHVVDAHASGKFAGRALLDLQLDRIKVGEKYYNIQTDHFKQETGSRGKNTAEKVGGGAIAGAILGGIFGGGKGAAIGSAAGAGAGGGVQAASKKPDIKLSSEKVLTFTLQSPVTIVPTSKPAREGKRLETNSAESQ
jgi:hypothetical protein